MDADGNKLERVRIDNDPIRLLEMVGKAGPDVPNGGADLGLI